MKNNLITWLFLLLTSSGFAQEMGYDVFGTLTNPNASPYGLITLDTLKEAKTLKDINAKYRPSWVASYLAVEVASTCGAVVKKAVSTNDLLTQAQMDILRMADQGCRIDVEVDYIPKNTLKDNPPRKLNFSLRVVPIFEAKYPGGYPQLKAYLKENIIAKVSGTAGAPIELAKVSFRINEDGRVSEAQIVKTSEAVATDKLILEAICNMPKWSPAKNSQGVAIAQEFEFTMGSDLLRCDYGYSR
jgi:TonB family protein